MAFLNSSISNYLMQLSNSNILHHYTWNSCEIGGPQPTKFLEYETNLEATAATVSGWELISVLCRACAAGLFGLSFSLIGSSSFL